MFVGGGGGGGACGFAGGGAASLSCRLFWKLPAAALPAIRLKPVLTGGGGSHCQFLSKPAPVPIYLRQLNGRTCITADVKMSQHLIVDLIIHPLSFLSLRKRGRGREREEQPLISIALCLNLEQHQCEWLPHRLNR